MEIAPRICARIWLTRSFIKRHSSLGRAANLLLGNWQLSFLISTHTGFPFYPVTGTDVSLTGIGQDRPDVVGIPYAHTANPLVWMNVSAFTPNAAGAAYFDRYTNLTLFFQIHEHHRVKLRFEFFNTLNQTNFNAPVNSLKSATFGISQSSGDPRVLQFALKCVLNNRHDW